LNKAKFSILYMIEVYMHDDSFLAASSSLTCRVRSVSDTTILSKTTIAINELKTAKNVL
jgi:hypothetical protein